MFKEVKIWMHRNARELELNLWKCLFEDGSKEAVIDALLYYQNEDGGFGNTIEADSWNPNSTPYSTLVAINILEQIKYFNLNHPIYKGILKYLESGEGFAEYGWSFSIPSNNEFAHAPWWTYSEEANAIESIGLTAELGAFLLKYGNENSAICNKVEELIPELINKLMKESDLGAMGVGGCIILMDTLKKLNRKEYEDLRLQNRLSELVQSTLEEAALDWERYGMRPSDYIKNPQSIYYEENKELVKKEIQYLKETKPKNDVWGINWTWFDNMQCYGKEFILSENWWKAMKAIEKVCFLKSFQVI